MKKNLTKLFTLLMVITIFISCSKEEKIEQTSSKQLSNNTLNANHKNYSETDNLILVTPFGI